MSANHLELSSEALESMRGDFNHTGYRIFPLLAHAQTEAKKLALIWR